jgi:Uma2 family endonuclease
MEGVKRMSTPTTATKLMTAEEFYEFVNRPENAERSFELVRGEVSEEMPRPGELHCVICSNVNFILGTYLRQVKRGRVLCNDPGILLEREPDTVRGPDVAYLSSSPKYAELNPKWIEEIPVLTVEVLSPNDKPGRVMRKAKDYLKSGVKMVWVIDPEDREVAVWRPGAEPEMYDDVQHLDGGDVLPGFRCAVADFFFTTGDQPS